MPQSHSSQINVEDSQLQPPHWPSGPPATSTTVIPSSEQVFRVARYAAYLARILIGLVSNEALSLHQAIAQLGSWEKTEAADAANDRVEASAPVEQLLRFLSEDLENGYQLPAGWDEGLPPQWGEHPLLEKILRRSAPKQWTEAEAREWFMDRINERSWDDVAWSLRCVQELIDNLAHDPDFSERAFRDLVPWLRNMTGKAVPLKLQDLMVTFRQSRKALCANRVETHGETGRRLLQLLQRGGEVRYDKGQFWQWNGSRFEPLDEARLYMFVAETAQGVLAVRHRDYQGLMDVLKHFSGRSLDQLPGLNFANGFLGPDLLLQAHNEQFAATWTLSFDYKPDRSSACVRWLAFLRSCWGMEPDFEQRVLALQEMFAATLFGIAPQYQRAFLLFGKAGSGKTEMLNVLTALLPPDAVGRVGPHQWGRRFALTGLISKTVNICGELPENGMIIGNKFKEMVDGSPQRTEFKYRDAITFVPTCAHWFASNSLPTSQDTSRGFLRRWLILDFNHPVAGEDKIKRLAEQIVAEERDAIAAWAVAGLDRLVNQRGYTLPECHNRRSHQMHRLVNPVVGFLEDAPFLTRGPQLEMPADELYDDYRFYSRSCRRRPVERNRFLSILEELGYEIQPREDREWVVGVARVGQL